MGRFYRGVGGSIFELDPPNPKLTNLVEIREQMIARGDLIEIPAERIRRVETPQYDQRTGMVNGVAVTFEEILPDAPDDATESSGAAPPKEPTKAELVAQAATLGIDVDPKWTKAQVAEAIANSVAGPPSDAAEDDD